LVWASSNFLFGPRLRVSSDPPGMQGLAGTLAPCQGYPPLASLFSPPAFFILLTSLDSKASFHFHLCLFNPPSPLPVAIAHALVFWYVFSAFPTSLALPSRRSFPSLLYSLLPPAPWSSSLCCHCTVLLMCLISLHVFTALYFLSVCLCSVWRLVSLYYIYPAVSYLPCLGMISVPHYASRM
jgi:hypothetical protein